MVLTGSVAIYGASAPAAARTPTPAEQACLRDVTRETLYGIYYNPKTHQCVQLTNANHRVASADDIGTHPKCR